MKDFAEHFTFLPVFQSNVPFLSAIAHIAQWFIDFLFITRDSRKSNKLCFCLSAILVVELGLTGLTSTSRSIRTTCAKSFALLRSSDSVLSVRPHILILSHCHKLFTSRWMDSDGCVEVSFGCAHFNGYGKALNHFVNAISNSVKSDYFFVCTCCD